MSDPGTDRVELAGVVRAFGASAVGILAHGESSLGGEPADRAPEADAPAGEGEGKGDVESEAGSAELSPEQKEEKVQSGLAAARQVVDTLGMLETKTQGNLTTEERQLLQGVLTELRITYARVADRLYEGRTDLQVLKGYSWRGNTMPRQRLPPPVSSKPIQKKSS